MTGKQTFRPSAAQQRIMMGREWIGVDAKGRPVVRRYGKKRTWSLLRTGQQTPVTEPIEWFEYPSFYLGLDELMKPARTDDG